MCAAGLRALASGSAESVRQVVAWMTQTILAPPRPDTLTGASTRTLLPEHDSGDFIESGCLPPDPSTDGDGSQEEPPELAEWTTDDGIEDTTSSRQRRFDSEENALLRQLCTRSVDPTDFRFNRGARRSNQTLAAAFNAEMQRRRSDHRPRPVAQISGRINRPDFREFLSENGVTSLRATSQRWAETEENILVHAFAVEVHATPQQVVWINGRPEMSSELLRRVASAAQRNGISRTARAITEKLKRMGDLHRWVRGPGPPRG